MSDRDALHAAICANPDDDTPRLIFADWLDDRGEAKRAAYIRASIEEYRQSTADTSASAMHEFFSAHIRLANVLVDWSDVELEMGKLHAAIFETQNLKSQPTIKSEKLPQIKGVKYGLISRGFFKSIHITKPADFLKHQKTLFRASPITSLWFERLNLEEARELTRSSDLSRIREIGFGRNVEPEAIRAIGNHRDAIGVRKLELLAGEECEEQCEALASGMKWSGVNWLELRNLDILENSTPDSIVADMLCLPQFRRIKRLCAWGNELGNATARVIATVGLTDLSFLDLGINNIGNAGAVAIARSKLLPGLRYLDLSTNDFSGEAVPALIATPKLPKLTVLNIEGTSRNDLDLKPMTKTVRGPSLRALRIDGCELTGAFLQAFTSCSTVHGLWFLSLSSCLNGDRELRALTAGKGLSQLKILNLSHNFLTSTGMKVLAEWPALATLQWLDLSGNKIGDAGAKALVKSRYLQNLKHMAISGIGTARLRKHFGKKVVT
jgi:uncharacterized protein (TIGR02996 family)